MPKIKLDDLEYNTEDLSVRGVAVLKSLQFVETRLREIEHELAVHKTAKNTYMQSLIKEIEASGVVPVTESTAAEDK
tara:strand:- start:1111 stop:1341 length:231 start_codon:yes stop_codon:yes gene_type:complete